MQKLVFLYGPSCSGKSTLANVIMERANFFHVKRDTLKWMISDYHRDNKNQTELLEAVMLQMIEEGIKRGFNILIEGLAMENFEKENALYSSHCTVLPIKMIADKKTLEKRFHERVKSAQNLERKISNLSLDVFWELYKKFNIDLGYGFTIDTSHLTQEELAQRINEILDSPTSE
jgi:chloramphenicol 3-O-phosphotransferase